jgi:hypothetical protein
VLDVTSVPPVVSGAAVEPAPAARPTADTAPRPGQLVPLWRILLTLGWVGVFLAFAAVWKASEEIGIATWWLGPRSAPQPVVVRLLPFALAIAIGAFVAGNLRAAVWGSLAGSGLVAVIAAFDVSRSGGLALIEFAIAASIALVTLGALGGRYVARPGAATVAVIVDGARADDVFVAVTDNAPQR